MKSFLTAGLAVMFFTAGLSQSDFSQWRGPNRDGTYPGTNLLQTWPSGGPQLLWKYDGLGVGYASAAVADERVITVGTLDSISYLFGFDLMGTQLWKTRLSRDYMGEFGGTFSTPVINGGKGFVSTGLGMLYCFNPAQGNVIWSRDLIKDFEGVNPKSGYLDNLVIDGNLLICAPGGAARNIVALDQATGAVVWESKGTSEVSGFGTPTLAGHKGFKYYIYQDTTSIIALNVADGSLAWKHPRGCGTAVGSLFFHDGYLFHLADDASVLLKLADGSNPPEVAWTQSDFFPLQGDPVLIGNRLYGKSKGKKYLTIDWTTGKTIGSIPATAMVVTSVACGGLIYAYDIDGNFSLLKPGESGVETVSSFKILGGTKYHCSHPVISNGRLYVRHDNSLFVYNLLAADAHTGSK